MHLNSFLCSMLFLENRITTNDDAGVVPATTTGVENTETSEEICSEKLEEDGTRIEDKTSNKDTDSTDIKKRIRKNKFKWVHYG